MITLKVKGNYKKANSYLEKLKEVAHKGQLDEYGRMGVEALRSATPIDSGKTADSWSYSIERNNSGTKIVWSNSNINDGVNIAIIIQFGHGTGTGGYVSGIDYINPALKPVFDDIANKIAQEVRNL